MSYMIRNAKIHIKKEKKFYEKQKTFFNNNLSVATILTSLGFMTPVVSYASEAKMESVSENAVDDFRKNPMEERPSVSENAPQGNKGDKPEIKDEMQGGNKAHRPGKNEEAPDKNMDNAEENTVQSDENGKLDEVTGLKVKKN